MNFVKYFFLSLMWSFLWTFLIMYFFGAFVNWDFNPENWAKWFRVIIFVVATIWALGVHYTAVHKQVEDDFE